MLKLKRAFSIDINSIFYNKHVQAKNYADKVMPSSESVDHFDEKTKKTVKTTIDYSKFGLYNSAVNEEAKTFKGSGEFFIAFAYDNPSDKDKNGGITSVFDASDEKVVDAIRTAAHQVICEYIKNFMGKEYSDKLVNNIDLLQPIVNTVSNRLLGFTFGYAIRFQGKIDFTVGQWLNEATGDDLTLSKIALGIRNGVISVSAKFGLAALHAILSEGAALLSDIVSFQVKTTYGDFGIPGAKYLKQMGNVIADFAKTTEKKFLDWLKKATTLSVNANTFIQLFREQFSKDYPGSSVNEIEVRLINSELQYLQQRQKCSMKLINMFNSKRCLTKQKYCIKVVVRENDPNYSFYNIPAIKSLTYRVLGKIYGHVPYLSHLEYQSFDRDKEFKTGTFQLKSHENPISFEKSGNVVVARIQDVTSMHLKSRNQNLIAYRSPEAVGSLATESTMSKNDKKFLIIEKLFNSLFSNSLIAENEYIFESTNIGHKKIKHVVSIVKMLYDGFYKKHKGDPNCFKKFIDKNFGADDIYKQVAQPAGATIIKFDDPKPSSFSELQHEIKSRKSFFDELYYVFSKTNSSSDARGSNSAIWFGVDMIFRMCVKDINKIEFDVGKFAITEIETSSEPDYSQLNKFISTFAGLVNKYNKEAKTNNKSGDSNNNSIFQQIDSDTAEDIYLIKIPYLTLNSVNSDKS